MKYKILLLALIAVLFSCNQTANENESKKLKVVCTTGILGDMVSNILGNHATVSSLMGPGVDPHLYRATQGDLKQLSSADVIVHNGLHLEGKMGEIFEKLKAQKVVFTASDALDQNDLINNSNFAGAYDPHIWFDLNLWSKVCKYLSKQFAQMDDLPTNQIEKNGQLHASEIAATSKWVKQQIQSIPQQQRVLITAHDAFSYFGRAYNIEVRGLQGISTASEYGLKDVSKLVNFIVERKIRAVFVESSVSERSLKAVITGCNSKGQPTKIGGMLYSDALGEIDSPKGTYLGMVKYNVKTIVSGLKNTTINEQ